MVVGGVYKVAAAMESLRTPTARGSSDHKILTGRRSMRTRASVWERIV